MTIEKLKRSFYFLRVRWWIWQSDRRIAKARRRARYQNGEFFKVQEGLLYSALLTVLMAVVFVLNVYGSAGVLTK